MEVAIPEVAIPQLKIPRGFFINVHLLGVGIVIPWADVILWGRIVVLKKIVLFNTDDIVNPLMAPLMAIPKLVWSLFESTLNKMAEDYYAKHSSEEEEE